MHYEKKRVPALGKTMAYVEVGTGDPIVFLHGNITSSDMWRNIIPHLEGFARCIAIDNIGQGDSDKLDDSGPGSYRLAEHQRYTDAALEERAEYRRPYPPGEARRPTLTWPREIPIEGEPADTLAIVNENSAFLRASPLPKLFTNTEPGAVLVGEHREIVRGWPNLTEVTVPGLHYCHEDSPDEIGRALADWYRGLG